MTVEALVLRRRNRGESDRRLSLLTRSHGRIEAIARGARKPQSRLAGCSEPLVMGQFELAAGSHATFLRQAQVQSSFPGLRADLMRLSLALALTEIFAVFTLGGLTHEEPFDFLVETLGFLESSTDPRPAAVWGFLRALEMEGVRPGWLICVDSGEAVRHNPVAVSPTAGGALSEDKAQHYVDVSRVAIEELVALERTSELDAPPPRIRNVNGVLHALAPFLRHFSHDQLPCLTSALEVLPSD